MRKCIIVIHFLILCLGLVGCDKEISEENKQMPGIVFMYKSYEIDSEWYESCIIDKEGNIYYTDEKDVFDYTLKDLMDKYEKGKIIDEMTFLGTLDVAEIQKMYNLYWDVVDDEYEIISSEECVDAVVVQKAWCAVNYDVSGDIRVDYIYQDGNAIYYPSDERAWDIVNWMNEVMGVETMTQPSK